MNTTVKFELAKLLKEKGFDKKVRYNHDLTGELHNVGLQNHNEHSLKVSAPTIAEVVMWLYEKHGIWIWVPIFSKMFIPYVMELEDTWGFREWHGSEYNSPTEAYSAAIEYTLNNLI